MSKVSEHLIWCLKDKRRLIKTKPDIELAKKHMKKSEYNYGIMQTLEGLKIADWALNAGFYSIYHCLLAILAKKGYESRNQSCTMTVILSLINDDKLEMDKDLVLQFDTIEAEKSITNPTVREWRELSTYGVKSSVDREQVKKLKELILKVQRQTINILEE